MTEDQPVGVPERTGPALLLVPGSGHDARLWGAFADRLVEHHPVVPSTAGRADLLAVIAAGDGAAEATRLARDGHARAVVLLCPSPVEVLPETGLDYDGLLAERLPDYGWVVDVSAITDPVLRRQAIADHLIQAVAGQVSPRDLDRLHDMYRDHADTLLDPTAGPHADRLWLHDLSTLDVPVLVVAAGVEEEAATIAAAVARRARRGRFIRLDPTLGPLPWLTEPSLVAGMVIEFLGSTS